MSLSVISVFEDAQDALLEGSNGELSIQLFNRFSKLAELDIIDIATGDIKGQQLPEPYTTQKIKDLCARFIFPQTGQVQNAKFPFPKDYYGFENMVMLGVYGRDKTECEDDAEPKTYDILDDADTPVELLDGEQFTKRCHTYIKAKVPSFTKPITQIVDNTFEFMPKDLGSIKLTYYRYPKFAQIKSMIDQQFLNEVPDPVNSDDYEWDEKTRPLLVWFIVNRFVDRTSNKARKEFNDASKDIRKP